MKTPAHQPWNPASWQTRPAQQQPVYRDQEALLAAVAQLSRLPPIVVSWEVERLREELAAAMAGMAAMQPGRARLDRVAMVATACLIVVMLPRNLRTAYPHSRLVQCLSGLILS